MRGRATNGCYACLYQVLKRTALGQDGGIEVA